MQEVKIQDILDHYLIIHLVNYPYHHLTHIWLLFEQRLAGPYNPNRYKDYYVPRTLPKNEEIVEFVQSQHSVPTSPIRNQRHINPVRESGPLPSYDGTYTMEDIRGIY